jgi:cell division protein FtsN
VEKNAFLNARTDMHSVVNGAYQQLAQTKDPSDPAFYTELNNRLKQELPQYLSEQLVDPNAADADLDDEDEDDEEDSTPAQPQSTQQPVSPSGRTTQQKPKGKQKVKLTRDEVAIARQIGITPEQYAKQKAAGATPNGYTQVGG